MTCNLYVSCLLLFLENYVSDKNILKYIVNIHNQILKEKNNAETMSFKNYWKIMMMYHS